METRVDGAQADPRGQRHTHLMAPSCRYAHSDVETLKETKRPLWGNPAVSGRGRSPDRVRDPLFFIAIGEEEEGERKG